MNRIYSKNETLNCINSELQKREISNKDIALILNVSESAVSYKLSGKRDFKIQELITLADLFDMDLMSLIQFKGDDEIGNS